MANMQAVVFDASRPAEHRNPADRSIARERLRTAYDWLEANLDQSPWAIGEQFTLADCAAAPSLFYSDWVEEIDERYPQLKGTALSAGGSSICSRGRLEAAEGAVSFEG
jgi:glutathione S-transferase